jgi:hypothetical protein
MRKLLVLVAVFTLPSLAEAKRKQRTSVDPRLTYVDDEPMKPAAAAIAPQVLTRDPHTTVSGTKMDVNVKTPEVDKVAVTGPLAQVRTGEAPVRVDDGATASGDAFNELVARQMRKNQPSIDACVAAAVRRRPSAYGTVQLAVVVSEKKIKSVHVQSDTVRDIDLDACLVKAGLGWKLQVAAAKFTWPVTLSPSASR